MNWANDLMIKGMNQDLCVSRGQEGPNFSYVPQVVKSYLCHFWLTEVLDSWTLKNNQVVKSYRHLILVVSLLSGGNDQYLSFIRIRFIISFYVHIQWVSSA